MKIEFSIGRCSTKLSALVLAMSLLVLSGIQTGSSLHQGRDSDEWKNQAHEALRETEESFGHFPGGAAGNTASATAGTSKNRGFHH